MYLSSHVHHFLLAFFPDLKELERFSFGVFSGPSSFEWLVFCPESSSVHQDCNSSMFKKVFKNIFKEVFKKSSNHRPFTAGSQPPSRSELTNSSQKLVKSSQSSSQDKPSLVNQVWQNQFSRLWYKFNYSKDLKRLMSGLVSSLVCSLVSVAKVLFRLQNESKASEVLQHNAAEAWKLKKKRSKKKHVFNLHL